jgi:sugar O-acyltransferase (sialic acid O-acetyltransferase NeuD family)
MSRVVIFGAGTIADDAYHYLTADSPHEVVAFTVDRAYLREVERLSLPVIAFEDVESAYPPNEYQMFVAVGYQELNSLRARKYDESKAKGYSLVSYISTRASNIGHVEVGDNCFILEFAVLQPSAKIGNDVFVWSGNHIGHRSSVGDHCYIAGQAMVAGGTVIEPYCFIGVNATIGHEVTIGTRSFVGAGSLITKNVEPDSAYVAQDTPRYRLDAKSFLRITKMH